MSVGTWNQDVKRWLGHLVTAIALVDAGLAIGATTTATAVNLTYDASAVACDDAQASDVSAAALSQFAELRERSASPQVGVRGTSTTPLAVRTATNTASGLGDDVVLVRGGTNTPDRFAGGSGVTSGASGNLQGVSVNSGSSVEAAAQGIRNKQIGVSTVGQVRDAGGTVVRAPTPGNAGHCLTGGLSAEEIILLGGRFLSSFV